MFTICLSRRPFSCYVVPLNAPTVAHFAFSKGVPSEPILGAPRKIFILFFLEKSSWLNRT